MKKVNFVIMIDKIHNLKMKKFVKKLIQKIFKLL